jgi:hypothetical protein
MRRMFDPQFDLLSTLLAACVNDIEGDPASTEPWERVRQAVRLARVQDADLIAAIEARDAAALRSIVTAWSSGKRHLTEPDRELLKRAIKAFRKSLKVTRLDAESSIGGGPMSSGRNSGIAGMRPPDRYPRDVWEELARQKRLLSVGHGIYELPPE